MLVSKGKKNRQLGQMMQKRKCEDPDRPISSEKSKRFPIQRISTLDIDCYVHDLLSTGYPESPLREGTPSNEEANPQ